MSDKSDPHVNSSKRDTSDGSSTTSIYSVAQEAKRRALSAYRKTIPPMGLEQRNKAKTEVIWARAGPKKGDLLVDPDQAKPSTVAKFLADDDTLGEVPEISGNVVSKDGGHESTLEEQEEDNDYGDHHYTVSPSLERNKARPEEKQNGSGSISSSGGNFVSAIANFLNFRRSR